MTYYITDFIEMVEPPNELISEIIINKRNGKYIEIGSGSSGNVTKKLESELGWTGILVEANPISFKKLQINRPKNLLLNCVVSNTPRVEFSYYHGDSADMSAIKNTVYDDISCVYYNDEIVINEKKTVINTDTQTLTNIIPKNEYYDLLIIDVNGHERNVLQSWDFKPNIEYIVMNSSHHIVADYEQTLVKHDYYFYSEILVDSSRYEVWKKHMNPRCIIH